ncbi:unnamed protein product [Anisakis simplex]|uniref:NADH dehydrogenase [ubiquinone] iron-sulfur protein 4, mitochondrial n=1 Tax=Anisakis simplex TaxID=6269 RepID=A0A158PNY1_ANISI|nr:unnamed protein product [Anisakis simplex]
MPVLTLIDETCKSFLPFQEVLCKQHLYELLKKRLLLQLRVYYMVFSLAAEAYEVIDSMLGIRACVQPLRIAVRGLASTDKTVPVTRLHDAKRKSLQDVLEPAQPKTSVTVVGEHDEVMDIAGVPEEHMEQRTARIFKPAREATQTAWNNTKMWKIELDNRERWENPLMGWSSTGDPLSNISMNLDFASKEDAINFCVKNRWNYEVDEPHERRIKPKSYGWNFAWNKRTRISTK